MQIITVVLEFEKHNVTTELYILVSWKSIPDTESHRQFPQNINVWTFFLGALSWVVDRQIIIVSALAFTLLEDKIRDEVTSSIGR